MKTLQTTKPIWHAIAWIVIYVVLVNIGDAISESLGIANLATSLLLIALSIGLLVYVVKNHWLETYGLMPVQPANFRQTWFYIPLIVMAFMQYVKGINPDLSIQDIVMICVLMVGVGFLEELIFRGFLFQAILKKGSLNRAVIISGVTFGIGHIVNLARGYSAADQVIQIVAAICIGVALAYCVAVTHNIVPGVIFHILFNISGMVTNNNVAMETGIVSVIVVITVLYSVYLRRSIPTQARLRAV